MSPMVRTPLSIELALLGLFRSRPRYGYEIHHQLTQPTGLGLIWRLKQSQLYALLDRLEGEGLLEARLEQQESRPPRKIFKLTEQGLSAFLEWLQSPVPHGRMLRQEFLAKLYFARNEPAPSARLLLEAQRQACRDWLGSLKKQAESLSSERKYDWLVCQYRIRQSEAVLPWLDLCEKTLLDATIYSGQSENLLEADITK
ncbi:MAG: PadR family transcriptional regulator [Chloroflexi bacterium]|nr:PadR family transcriptional regulator [Chloroflexota bacterium]